MSRAICLVSFPLYSNMMNVEGDRHAHKDIVVTNCCLTTGIRQECVVATFNSAWYDFRHADIVGLVSLYCICGEQL